MRRPKLRFKALRDRTLKIARAWGIQRVCHVTLALCQQDMGKERLGAVVVMGSAQWPGANQESGGNNQGSSVWNIERCCFGSK